jgi:hypothetical protein
MYLYSPCSISFVALETWLGPSMWDLSWTKWYTNLSPAGVCVCVCVRARRDIELLFSHLALSRAWKFFFLHNDLTFRIFTIYVVSTLAPVRLTDVLHLLLLYFTRQWFEY